MYISERMKGVSAVIATIMMLVITIALAGVAYLYISGMFNTQIARTIGIEESATFCNSTGIYLYVENHGTQSYKQSNVQIGLQGGNLQSCNKTSAADATLTPGGAAVMCENVITGTSQGFNNVIVAGTGLGPTNTLRLPVSC